MSKQDESGKEVETLALFIGASLVLLYLAWYKWGHYITNISILGSIFLVEKANDVYQMLPKNELVQSVFFLFVADVFVYEKDMVLGVLNGVDVYHPTFAEGHRVLTIFGYFFRFPIALFGLWGILNVYKNSRPSQLRRKFTIFSLAKYCVQYFPQIRPALNAKLLEQNFDEGPHRQEVSPIRFAILCGAISINENGIDYKVRFGKNLKVANEKRIYFVQDNYDEDEGLPILHNKCVIDIKPIRESFVSQITHLGRWSGSKDLPEYARALYAVFLLYIKGGEVNKQTAQELLNQFNRTFKSTKEYQENLAFDISGVDEIIEQYEDNVAVKNVIKQHTFVTTVLVALFFRATNKRAKLPPNQFYWLKEVNRTLWYALHQNLSPAAWTEAGGCRGIFLTEQKLKSAANYPFTDNAIRGFLDYLNEEGWLVKQPKHTSELAM